MVAGGLQGLFLHHSVFNAQGTLFVTYNHGPGANDLTNGRGVQGGAETPVKGV